MFLRGINEFELKFKTFDRLNVLLFNVWRGKAADIYRDSDLARIANEYRNYISQVRTLAQEAKRLNEQLAEKESQIIQLHQALMEISKNPQIHDCSMWKAECKDAVYYDNGEVRYYETCAEARYVAKGVRAHNEKEIAARFVGPCDEIRVELLKKL